MSRPKFFRDPIHVQIRFSPVDLEKRCPTDDVEKQQSWLLRGLIDQPDFQRLRFIRQTGLANLVFHGAEHSRFNHSMGVLYLARTMYRCITRNMGEKRDPRHELEVASAALLHDIGHGPFSHTLEEILKELKVDFHHEHMTVRLLTEDGSGIKQRLSVIDSAFPEAVSAYIDYQRRLDDHWRYRIVSSQLDADRLDYLLRDAYYCGLRGHGFDYARILDLLQHADGKKIAVDEGALEAVEAYLVTLDQLYRAIYYHHTVRASSVLLTSTLRRAVDLTVAGDKTVFPSDHPLKLLTEQGSKIDLAIYTTLGEHHVWALVDGWRAHKDKVLADLSDRLKNRKLFKALDTQLVSLDDFKQHSNLMDRARALVVKQLPHVDKDTAKYYVCEDAPERLSYKKYDWTPESPDDSIWIIRSDGKGIPIEDDERSPVLNGLRTRKYFPRLMIPAEIRELL